ncbi:olfactory receptor 7E178-like [Castor canadensis]|uniref:Olfactory receptor 7E178-like n=1 Tax=Castor canadensis TaxID=51338 RepID=A0AC58KWV0_CASCN
MVRSSDLHFFIMAQKRTGSTQLLEEREIETLSYILQVLPDQCWCARSVGELNLTHVSEFHLLGISEDPDLQPFLFVLFLFMYLVTVVGNLIIILAVIIDSNLHTPMYFFLSNLSLTDICFISTTVPKMITDIQTHNRVISYLGCLTQMSLVIVFGCMEDMLLTVMAYDRFVAICHPLHYPVIMNPRLCASLVLASFFISMLDSQLHNLIVLQFMFFKKVEISSFCCEPAQILNLDCSDTFAKTIITCLVDGIFGFLPISIILISYYKIISSILKITSLGGRYKAFSTCGSHLSVVCLFYGTAIGVYLESSVSQSFRQNMASSVMYTIVTPMLNPFIYSLRNRDIINTLRRLHTGKANVSLRAINVNCSIKI